MSARRLAATTAVMAGVAALLVGLAPPPTAIVDQLAAPQQLVAAEGPEALLVAVVAALAWANALSQTNDDRPSDAIATSSFDVRDKRFPARLAAFPIGVVSIMFDLFRKS